VRHAARFFDYRLADLPRAARVLDAIADDGEFLSDCG
jgi:hypothetical protein